MPASPPPATTPPSAPSPPTLQPKQPAPARANNHPERYNRLNRDRQIKYCTTSDGVSIAYAIEGEGKPLISVNPIGFSHVELGPRTYAAIQVPLSERFRFITYDARGTGMSDRGASDFSLDSMLRDLEAIVDRSGFDTFALAGFISGGPVALRYTAENPDRVSHLVLGDGWSDFTDIRQSVAYRTGMPMLEEDWLIFTETFATVLWAFDSPEFGKAFAQHIRACCDHETMKAIWKAMEEYDVTEYLPRITAPTLVIHNKNTRWFTMDTPKRLAAAIPDARIALIDDITYAPVPDLISDFVGDATRTVAPGAAGTDSTFRTILFTDLVGHTEMMSRLGDEKGRDVLREHEKISREVLAANGGTEVKTMGDGFMASFNSVAKSIECAIALQRAFDEREGEPLSVRVGINAGEPIEEDGDLFGATVILASRIAAKAKGGEIFVADTVRGLSSGKGFLFADRGEFVAKGIEDPVRIYEVNWRQ